METIPNPVAAPGQFRTPSLLGSPPRPDLDFLLKSADIIVYALLRGVYHRLGGVRAGPTTSVALVQMSTSDGHSIVRSGDTCWLHSPPYIQPGTMQHFLRKWVPPATPMRKESTARQDREGIQPFLNVFIRHTTSCICIIQPRSGILLQFAIRSARGYNHVSHDHRHSHRSPPTAKNEIKATASRMTSMSITLLISTNNMSHTHTRTRA